MRQTIAGILGSKPTGRGRWAFAAFLAFGFVSAAVAEDSPPSPPDFSKQVEPILIAKCIRCHGERQKGGQLDMRTVDAMLKGGASGPAFKPGNSEKSLLVELIHFKEMPPKRDRGPRVTPEEFVLIKSWIDAGGKP